MRGSKAAGVRSALGIAVLYGLAMLVGSFHQDIACHRDARNHCASCQLNQTAQNVEAVHAPVQSARCPAGRVVPLSSVTVHTPISRAVSDRAPPSDLLILS